MEQIEQGAGMFAMSLTYGVSQPTSGRLKARLSDAMLLASYAPFLKGLAKTHNVILPHE